MNVNILGSSIDVRGPAHGDALARLILLLAATFTCRPQINKALMKRTAISKI